MCDVVTVAAAGVAVAAGGAVASYSQQASAQKKGQAYNAQVEQAAQEYRLESMQYQNEVWAQDLAYSYDMLTWAEGEWDRGVRADKLAREAIEKNTLAAVGQTLLRQVEEDMAVVAQGTEVRRQGAQARARLEVQDRGVEGNSVDAILNDVTRQEGEVLNVMAMNRAASLRQLNRQAIALDAQGDQQLGALQLRTYAPNVQVRRPAPISPVNPQAPVAGPNVGGLVSGVVGGVTQGLTNYANWSGTSLGSLFGGGGSSAPTSAYTGNYNFGL